MTTTMTSKKLRTCRLCGIEKEIDLFEVDNRVKGGRTTRCRECKHGLDDRANQLYRRLKRRAEKDGQPLEVTRKELQGLFAAFDGKCIYCDISEEEAGRSHHVDHFIAVSDGGRHCISNLVLACASCNSSKGNDSFIEFYLRNKDEISDDNFNTLTHYLALISQQPVDAILKDYTYQFIKKQYGHLSDFLSDEDFEEIAQGVIEEKRKKAS